MLMPARPAATSSPVAGKVDDLARQHVRRIVARVTRDGEMRPGPECARSPMVEHSCANRILLRVVNDQGAHASEMGIAVSVSSWG